MASKRYYWVDVFADRKFEGNQLAVFPEADGLDEEDMQTIAGEMNLSETTFITGQENYGETPSYRTRIFTREEELPFAGHPTLGTAFVLRNLHGGDRILLNLKVGRIPVDFSTEGGRLFGEMTQVEPVFGKTYDRRDVARTLNLEESDLDQELPVETVSTGNPFMIVPFRTLDALRKVNPDFARMERFLGESDAKFMYMVSRETESPGASLHARMLFYGGEDPATGSAAGPAAAWMIKHGVIEPGLKSFIEQGIEMGRSSRIFVSGSIESGKPSGIKVGGQCFSVGRGEIDI